MIKKSFVLSVLCLLPFFVKGEVVNKSPFNNLEINIKDSSNYSFIVSGHFYGGGGNETGFPTNTLLANLDWVNMSEGSFYNVLRGFVRRC